MKLLALADPSKLHHHLGRELGVSPWHEISQRGVRDFAAITGDMEGIHIDPSQASEAGFNGTIAHGLYTLSLGPKFLSEFFQVRHPRLVLNYGFERVRFLSPVPVGCSLRMRARLTDLRPMRGGTRVTIAETFEVRGRMKPAAAADAMLAFMD